MLFLCISGAIAVGAAPDSPAFPSVSLAALILTARTALWQTSAGTRCLLRGETAGQWQQEAECHRHACSLLHPTVSLVVFFQRSLCEADAFPIPFKGTCWRDLALSGVAFIEFQRPSFNRSLFEDFSSIFSSPTDGYSPPVGAGLADRYVYVLCMGLQFNRCVRTSGLFLDHVFFLFF